MKKILVALMVLGALTAYTPSSASASWWYDFIHSDNDDYQDDSYLWEDEEETKEDEYYED